MITSTSIQTTVFDVKQLDSLFDALRGRGYKLVGPTVRDGAIILDEISSIDDLPAGFTDIQGDSSGLGGTYRLKLRDDEALFGYNTSPHSWKKYLHPPVLRLWSASREGGSLQVTDPNPEPEKLAFIGVRSCDLHAIFIQDKVFTAGPYVDTHYAAQRERAFILAVNCGQAGATCFCASMDTGPKATSGFDLSMTEVVTKEPEALASHYFVVEVGSDLGAEVLAEVSHRDATLEEIEQAEAIVTRTAQQMGRTLDTTGLKELLYASYEHPRWQEVAERCLSCGNCTMVCPTCFCTSVEDVSDLAGTRAERVRKWDSCFTSDFSYIHGGSVRQSGASRYRQWLTHKLGTWQDQFGTSGCVGCGRCITWCPVGIDITEEVLALRGTTDET